MTLRHRHPLWTRPRVVINHLVILVVQFVHLLVIFDHRYVTLLCMDYGHWKSCHYIIDSLVLDISLILIDSIMYSYYDDLVVFFLLETGLVFLYVYVFDKERDVIFLCIHCGLWFVVLLCSIYCSVLVCFVALVLLLTYLYNNICLHNWSEPTWTS